MVDMPHWKQYIEEHPEFFDGVMKAGQNIQLQYQFPKPLNRFECEESTIDFACARLDIDRERYLQLKEKGLAENPQYDTYCKEYPLPIGWRSVYMTYFRKGWNFTDLVNHDRHAFVERDDAFIGLAKRFVSKETIGWFLGLVKVYDRYMGTDKELGELSHDESLYVLFKPPFEFIEGMILLEGKLDGPVTDQLKDYEKYYNKNILGKVIVGRPQSNIQEWIEKVKPFFLQEPDLTQEKLAEYLDVNITSVRKNRIKAGFTKYEDLRQFFKKT